jgi:hypothetical protein
VIPRGSLVVKDENLPGVIGANELPLKTSGHVTLDAAVNGGI